MKVGGGGGLAAAGEAVRPQAPECTGRALRLPATETHRLLWAKTTSVDGMREATE